MLTEWIEEMIHVISAIIKKLMNNHSLSIYLETDLFLDLAFDSLMILELVLELEQHYNLNINDEDILGFKTIQDIETYLRSRGFNS